MRKLNFAMYLSLVLTASCVYASGIHYKEINLEEVVTNSTFILQAKYIGEAKDDYGPHSQYQLQKMIHSSATNTNANLKVWAAHAEVWGRAMAEAERTGRHLWFTVPEYKGKGREGEPEKGRSYILLLKQLSRETDFLFYANGALLNTNMLQEINTIIRKIKKDEQSDGMLKIDAALLDVAQKSMPQEITTNQLAQALQSGLWNSNRTAVAVSIPQPKASVIFVFLRQTNGTYFAADASRVESANFGVLGRPRTDYEGFETTPTEWLYRTDGWFQVHMRTHAWREGRLYTTSEPLLIRPDGRVMYR